MQVFYFAILGKLIGHVLFGRLLVHIGDKDNPALDSCVETRFKSEMARWTNMRCSHRAALVSSLTWVDSTLSYVGSVTTVSSLPPSVRAGDDRARAVNLHTNTFDLMQGRTCCILEASASASDSSPGCDCFPSQFHGKRMVKPKIHTFINVHLIVRHGGVLQS